MDIFNEDLSIPVNLIREWCFCPRVIYYQEVLQVKAFKPLWVKQGEKSHNIIEKIEKRRNLSRYNLASAKKEYNVFLKSDKYELHGIADWILETNDSIYVVEYKLNPNPNSLGHKLQVCAYAMLAEEKYNKKCNCSFLASKTKVYKVDITPDLRQKVIETIKNIQQILESGVKPNSSAGFSQCIQCEYINFCNDRD